MEVKQLILMMLVVDFLPQIFVDSVGSGYEIGDDIIFTNTDTGGGSGWA